MKYNWMMEYRKRIMERKLHKENIDDYEDELRVNDEKWAILAEILDEWEEILNKNT